MTLSTPYVGTSASRRNEFRNVAAKPAKNSETDGGVAASAPSVPRSYTTAFQAPRERAQLDQGTKKTGRVTPKASSAPKGQYKLQVDPKVTEPDRSRLQAVVDQLNTPEGQRFLRMPNRSAKGGTITITTRPEAFTEENAARIRENLAKGGKYFRGFSQGTNNELPKTVFLNLNSDKEPFRILVHELCHIKCPGLAKDSPNGDHSPEFYKLACDTLSALGVEPNSKDRNGIDISRARSPAGTVDPLDWYPGYKP